MFIIYGYGHPKDSDPQADYISGIFKRREDAEKYLASIPESYRAKNRLQEIVQTNYPLYFIEEWDQPKSSSSKLQLITRRELAKKIATVPKVSDNDHVYFNYYRFMEDYQGIRPGQDCLGSTDHYHLTNDCIVSCLEGMLKESEIPRSNCYFYCNMCGNPGAAKYHPEGYEFQPLINRHLHRAEYWDLPEKWLSIKSNSDTKVFCGEKCRKAWFGE